MSWSQRYNAYGLAAGYTRASLKYCAHKLVHEFDRRKFCDEEALAVQRLIYNAAVLERAAFNDTTVTPPLMAGPWAEAVSLQRLGCPNCQTDHLIPMLEHLNVLRNEPNRTIWAVAAIAKTTRYVFQVPADHMQKLYDFWSARDTDTMTEYQRMIGLACAAAISAREVATMYDMLLERE